MGFCVSIWMNLLQIPAIAADNHPNGLTGYIFGFSSMVLFLKDLAHHLVDGSVRILFSEHGIDFLHQLSTPATVYTSLLALNSRAWNASLK
jgi:hypothetical protein